MKWFGREPALWLAVIQGALAVLVGFQLEGLSADQAAMWMALTNAIVGVVTAIRTRPWAVSAFTSAVSVVATLAAAYGLDLSQQNVASVNLLVVSVVTLLARGQISPAEDAHRTGVLGGKPTSGSF